MMTRVLFWDEGHRRRQITIESTHRDNLFLDLEDHDRTHGTDYYGRISPHNIRQVLVKADGETWKRIR